MGVSPDGTLYGEVLRWNGETILGYVKAWRPDDRTLQIEFPIRTLRRGLDRYSWDVSVTSSSRISKRRAITSTLDGGGDTS